MHYTISKTHSLYFTIGEISRLHFDLNPGKSFEKSVLIRRKVDCCRLFAMSPDGSIALS